MVFWMCIKFFLQKGSLGELVGSTSLSRMFKGGGSLMARKFYTVSVRQLLTGRAFGEALGLPVLPGKFRGLTGARRRKDVAFVGDSVLPDVTEAEKLVVMLHPFVQPLLGDP